MVSANLRVVHCSPDAGRVAVSVGDVHDHRLEFGETTGYVGVEAGPTEVGVHADEDPDGTPFVRRSIGFEGGDVRTVLIVGMAARKTLDTVVLKDDPSRGEDHAHLRFVNAIPDAPPLELRFDDPIVEDDVVLSTEIAFLENGTYRPVPPGTHRFAVVAELDDERPEELFGERDSGEHSRSLTAGRSFGGGDSYTIVAVGRHEAEDYRVLVLPDAPATTTEGDRRSETVS